MLATYFPGSLEYLCVAVHDTKTCSYNHFSPNLIQDNIAAAENVCPKYEIEMRDLLVAMQNKRRAVLPGNATVSRETGQVRTLLGMQP